MKIVVYHSFIPGNGDYTYFEGARLEYRVEEGGALRIVNWNTPSGEGGNALFAAGVWTYVCHTTTPSRTPSNAG